MDCPLCLCTTSVSYTHLLHIREETTLRFHERVEIYYAFSGSASMEVNGVEYEVKPGALFCLYSHHFHHITQVASPLDVVVVRFHIGLFMYMSWEKHPRNANARLMYDTLPVIWLNGRDRERIELLVRELLEEQMCIRDRSMIN